MPHLRPGSRHNKELATPPGQTKAPTQPPRSPAGSGGSSGNAIATLAVVALTLCTFGAVQVLRSTVQEDGHGSPFAPSVRRTRGRRVDESADWARYWEQPASDGLARYALIPRPLVLRRITKSDKSHTVKNASSVEIVWHSDFHKPDDARLWTALAAFEKVLSLRSRMVGSTENLPAPVIVVIFRSNVELARKSCAEVAGYQESEFTASNMNPNFPKEWHQAIYWEGRLVVCAVDAEGAFRFATTLRQLLHPGQHKGHTNTKEVMASVPWTSLGSVPPFFLEDWPSYQWRALQLDVVRHFMPLDFLKKYLQAMAYYKANVFHWHLTDDQSWRIFIPSRPKLVNSSAHTSPEFYTPAEVKELLEFAEKLFIKVVPTVETPGHSLAALAAYPELACVGNHFEVPLTREGTYEDIMCVVKRETAEFARDVFTDIAAMFPGEYIHIGGDEAPTAKWETSLHVKAFAGMAGLKNLGPDILESWYCFIGNLLKKLGKTPIMWDDHFATRQYHVSKKCPGAEEDWVVQAWKMESPVGDDTQKWPSSWFPFRTIASPMKSVYLDYPVASIDFNETLTLAKFGRESDNVLGGCATMWTEDSLPKDVPRKVYPRFLGIAGRLWSRQMPPNAVRSMDESLFVAAHRHCSDDGPLRSEFSFSCGRFELRAGGRSSFWQNCRAFTNLEHFSQSFSLDRALDDDEETYFWAISPKEGDFVEVQFSNRRNEQSLGRWLQRLEVHSGAQDRPEDRLERGVLRILQWLPVMGKTPASYAMHWKVVGTFNKGVATANVTELMMGPVVSLRVTATETQMKWMAIREITAEEGATQPHPTLEELPALETWHSGRRRSRREYHGYDGYHDRRYSHDRADRSYYR